MESHSHVINRVSNRLTLLTLCFLMKLLKSANMDIINITVYCTSNFHYLLN